MLDYRKQVEELLKEREESSLGKWKSNEVELSARAAYEEDVRAKYPFLFFFLYFIFILFYFLFLFFDLERYSALMERQKEEFEEARKALLSDYTNEMERRDKLLSEQSAANKSARKVYEEEVRSKYQKERGE
jgi:hypothetical protein